MVGQNVREMTEGEGCLYTKGTDSYYCSLTSLTSLK